MIYHRFKSKDTLQEKRVASFKLVSNNYQKSEKTGELLALFNFFKYPFQDFESFLGSRGLWEYEILYHGTLGSLNLGQWGFGKVKFLNYYIKCIIFRIKLVCFVFPLTMSVLCSCQRIFQPLHCSARLRVVGRQREQTGQIL